MSIIQITLLVVGGIIFIVSFFLPAGRNKRKDGEDDMNVITDDHVKLMVEKEIDDSKSNISEIVDETITYAMEKGERAMERITNEKIMAINEYSDTVLKEIHKNQQEVVFLYDMLNDKHNTLLETVSQAAVTASEVRQASEALSAMAETTALPPVEVLDGVPAFSIFNPPVIEAEDERIIKERPEIEFGGSRNNNDIILEMHKEGKSNMAIARTLGLGISEVKLVIDLFED